MRSPSHFAVHYDAPNEKNNFWRPLRLVDIQCFFLGGGWMSAMDVHGSHPSSALRQQILPWHSPLIPPCCQLVERWEVTGACVYERVNSCHCHAQSSLWVDITCSLSPQCFFSCITSESLARFPSQCRAKLNRIHRKSPEVNVNWCSFPSATIMQTLESERIKMNGFARWKCAYKLVDGNAPNVLHHPSFTAYEHVLPLSSAASCHSSLCMLCWIWSCSSFISVGSTLYQWGNEPGAVLLILALR